MPITHFNKKQLSYLAGVGDQPKRRFPLGKYIYIAAIAAILVGGGHWAVRKYLFIEGKGILEPVLLDVKANISARIIENRFVVDQQAKQGDPMIILDKSDIILEIAAKDRLLEEQRILVQQRVLDATRELDSFKGRKQKAEGALKDANTEYGRAKRLLSQEAITQTQAMVLENAFKDAQREAVLLSGEVNACAAKLKAHEAEYAAFVAKMMHEKKQCEERLKETVLSAPRLCIIVEILKKPGELVRPGEVIMRVADPAEVIVKGYFGLEFESSVKTGDSVDLIFDDGYRTVGKIQKVYPEALALPLEYKRPYGTLERGVVAEIIPEDKACLSRILNSKARIILTKFNVWPLR